MVAAPALLGVERSLGGKRWVERPCDERLALALAQRHSLPDLVARLLAGRGVTLESVEEFLSPSLKTALPDPSHLLDLDLAVERLVRAIEVKEKLAVFGDYDVDGATSAAILQRFFAAVGCPLRLYVPDRMAEGYGPNAPALRRLHGEGISLVITVDCGVSAYEALSAAKEIGLDVIVVDHHVAEARLPPALAVVNPNRVDETSPHRHLAAVGVAFLLLIGLNRALREKGFYTADRPEPDLRQLLDLVALGTVADVVSLTGLNRVLVAQGLKVMEGWRNPGLKALAAVSRLDRRPAAWHLGFLLGPRVNAGGRVGRSDLGARLLSGDDPGEAARLAEELDRLNQERRAIESEVFDDALAQIEAAGPPQGLVFAVGEGWHPGVIGVVAGRLKERFSLPAFVIALDGEVGKGSGRSVSGVDMGQAVMAARQEGLLINGGGHPMAAGLTVAKAALGDLKQFLAERLGQALAALNYQPALSIDAIVQASGAKAELVREVARLAPFGQGNPAPRFALPRLRIKFADVVGASHLRLRLESADGHRLKSIFFRALDGEIGSQLLQAQGEVFDFAGRIEMDEWAGGDAVRFQVDDVARPK